jgi:asparagine synthase (glutamine-hydrolysing)
MSGFFAMVRQDGGPVDSSLLDKIADQLAFRGPDSRSVWHAANLGSCFAWMRTGPNRQWPCQPVIWDNRLFLWGDLRIDAQQELQRQLGDEDYPTNAKPTNEELLLRAWAKWGPASLDHLIGDFSFALWDSHEQTLWCARDFIGSRPFYYAQAAGLFCFTNTLSLLRLVPGISTEFDEVFMGDFLLQGKSADYCRTVYRDVKRLLAGHCLELSNGNLSLRRFCKLPVEEPLQLSRPEEYVEAYSDLLKTAVNERLPEGNIAIFLSGGLDSTSVCAVASQLAGARREQAKDQLKAFTIGCQTFFDDPEPALATMVARHLRIAHELVQYARWKPFEVAEHEQTLPEPLDDMFFPQVCNVYRKAAKHANVALTGDGGDEVLTGQAWPCLTHLWHNGHWTRIIRDFGGFLWRHKTIPPLRAGFRTKFRTLFQNRDPFHGYPRWLNDDFEGRTNLRQRWLALHDFRSTAEHPFHPAAYRQLHKGIWGATLEYEDAGWHRIPLEFRTPLLDLRLLKFLLRLPPIPWCMEKELCRQAMDQVLPRQILHRPKTPLLFDVREKFTRTADLAACLSALSPGATLSFVNWAKWCETLCHSQGFLTTSALRPASLFYWLKSVET